MVITGFQEHDLPLFESIVGIEVSCVIVIDCTKEVLLNRCRQSSAGGSDRYLSCAVGEKEVTTYFGHRSVAEKILRQHFRGRYGNVVHYIQNNNSYKGFLRAGLACLWETALAEGQSMIDKLTALGNVRPLKVDWLASVRWAESEVLVGAKRPEEGKTKTMSKQTESHAASAPLLAGPVQPVPAACPSESFCTWPVLGAYAVTDVFENYVGGAMESPSWPYDCWGNGMVPGFHSMSYQLPEQRGWLHQQHICQAGHWAVRGAWPPEEMVPGASSAAYTVYSDTDTSYRQVHHL